jgi:hypothetical protein
MDSIKALLEGEHSPGVYLWNGAATVEEIAALVLGQHGYDA